jgi:hypothetical protein
MDSLAGIVVGACVIASWSFGLVRDTKAILLDMNPDRPRADNLRPTTDVPTVMATKSQTFISGGWLRATSGP